MNRLAFFKNSLSALAASGFLKFGFNKLQSNKIKLLSTNIAGLQYYKGIENINNFKINDEVQLIREPNNKYDRNAIAIYWNKLKIGFIPRSKNLIIKNLIDGGQNLYSCINQINKEESVWEKIEINIYLIENYDIN